MADYEAMYIKLFNRITDVIEELKKIQRETEELYINNSEQNNKSSTEYDGLK